MRFSLAITLTAISLAMICPAVGHGASGSGAFEEGNALLAEGDLQGAMEAYSTAVRSDRENQQYVQQFMLIRQVVALESSLDKQTDPDRWAETAQSLRSFYAARGITSEAISIDLRMHSKLNTALTAAQLAESQLRAGQADEAAQVLGSLDEKKATPATQALRAVALARAGRLGEARKIAASMSSLEQPDAGTLYNLARMHAAVSEDEKALSFLTACFEVVPPSRLVNLKAHAQGSPEFARLADKGAFATVLKTESKITESKCSGGSSCAGCPMRGGCPSSQGK